MIIALPANSHPDFSLIKSNPIVSNNVVPKLNPKLKLLPDSSFVLEDVKYSPSQLKIQNIRKDFEVVDYFWYRDFYCAYVRINNYSYDESSNSITGYKNLDFAY